MCFCAYLETCRVVLMQLKYSTDGVYCLRCGKGRKSKHVLCWYFDLKLIFKTFNLEYKSAFISVQLNKHHYRWELSTFSKNIRAHWKRGFAQNHNFQCLHFFHIYHVLIQIYSLHFTVPWKIVSTCILLSFISNSKSSLFFSLRSNCQPLLILLHCICENYAKLCKDFAIM